jgi:DNA topoisomerase I
LQANDTKAKRKFSESDLEFDDNKKSAKSTAKGAIKKANPPKRKKKEESGMSEKRKGKQKVNGELDEDEDEDYRWWEAENANEDGTVKWNTLEHNGVYFPPEYVPHNVKMKYNGKLFSCGVYVNICRF